MIREALAYYSKVLSYCYNIKSRYIINSKILFSKNIFPLFIVFHFLSLNSCLGKKQPNILFLLADDWSWPHASIYGESEDVIKTPNFDAIAKEGVLFNHAYVAAPSCSPSRAAILTGQYPHRLEEAGYFVGMTGKGWGPGNYEVKGWNHNPAGKSFKNFKLFLDELSGDTPFCFWFGSHNPHRHMKKILEYNQEWIL